MTFSSRLLTIICKEIGNNFPPAPHWGQREERDSAHRENPVGSFLWGIRKDSFRINFDQIPSSYVLGLENNTLPGFPRRKFLCCLLQLEARQTAMIICHMANLYIASSKPMVFLAVCPQPLPPFDTLQSSLLN